MYVTDELNIDYDTIINDVWRLTEEPSSCLCANVTVSLLTCSLASVWTLTVTRWNSRHFEVTAGTERSRQRNKLTVKSTELMLPELSAARGRFNVTGAAVREPGPTGSRQITQITLPGQVFRNKSFFTTKSEHTVGKAPLCYHIFTD